MKFVSLYKTLLLIQKRVNGGKERGACPVAVYHC
jgi:hypothetical protein